MLRCVTRGIEARLDEYHKLHLDGGDECFLDIPSQNVLRSGDMERFMARAEEDPTSRTLRFELTTAGRDAMAHSRGLRNKRDIPASELNSFETAVRNLLQKTDDSKLPPKTIHLIRGFRLPDPDREPNMYRIYGSPWNRRLGVLWGCESVTGSSVDPLIAIERLKRRGIPPWLIWTERLLWLLAALVLLMLLAWLAMLGWEKWQKRNPELAPRVILEQPVVPAKVVETRPITGGVITNQFLRVEIDPKNGELPSKITAWAELPGTISFENQKLGESRKLDVDAKEPADFHVTQSGTYRIEWNPSPSTKNAHGEFIVIDFHDNTAAEVISQSASNSLTQPKLGPQPPGPIPKKPIPSQPSESSKLPVEKLKGPGKLDDKPTESNPPTKIPPPSPNPTQGGGQLIIRKTSEDGLSVTLVAQLKDAPNAQLTDIIWSVGEDVYRGNSHLVIKSEQIKEKGTLVEVEAVYKGNKVTGKSRIALKITVDGN